VSYIVLPKAGLKLLTLEEAKAQAEAKAKDTRNEQIILEAKHVVTPHLEVDVSPFGESK
jgi:hypothetical protein